MGKIGKRGRCGWDVFMREKSMKKRKEENKGKNTKLYLCTGQANQDRQTPLQICERLQNPILSVENGSLQRWFSCIGTESSAATWKVTL